MAIFYLEIKNISRSSGKSALASAAYQSGEKLKSVLSDSAYQSGEELESIQSGKTFNYGRKERVVYNEVMIPDHAPKSFQDRNTLWNAVEAAEKARDARLAKQFIGAIPRELNEQQQIDLIRSFVQNTFVQKGRCADFAIHDDGKGNPHFHLLVTTRKLTKAGKWAAKEKSVYALDPEGNRIPIIDPATGSQKIGPKGRRMWKRVKVMRNDWDTPALYEEWRQAWADEVNKYLAKEDHIDHRSYKRQGVKKIPQIHEGYAARNIESRGGFSPVMEKNRQIKEDNIKLQKIQLALMKNDFYQAVVKLRIAASAYLYDYSEQNGIQMDWKYKKKPESLIERLEAVAEKFDELAEKAVAKALDLVRKGSRILLEKVRGLVDPKDLEAAEQEYEFQKTAFRNLEPTAESVYKRPESDPRRPQQKDILFDYRTDQDRKKRREREEAERLEKEKRNRRQRRPISVSIQQEKPDDDFDFGF